MANTRSERTNKGVDGTSSRRSSGETCSSSTGGSRSHSATRSNVRETMSSMIGLRKRKRIDARTYRSLFTPYSRAKMSVSSSGPVSHARVNEHVSVGQGVVTGHYRYAEENCGQHDPTLEGNSQTETALECCSCSDVVMKQASSSTDSLPEGYYADITCAICKLTGVEKICDGKGCNRSCHLSCIDIPLRTHSPGVWLCTCCVKKKIKFGVYSVTKGIESIWNIREGKQGDLEYFVKYKGLAHIHNCWLTESEILLENPDGSDILSEFLEETNKNETIRWSREWTVPDRLLKKRFLLPKNEADEFFSVHDEFSNCNFEWLVKWKGLGYEHATWEHATSSFLCTSESMLLMNDFEKRQKLRSTYDQTKIILHTEQKLSLLPKILKFPAGFPTWLDHDHLHSVNQLREFKWKSSNAVFVDDQEKVMKTILFIMSLASGTCRPILIVSKLSSLYTWENNFHSLAPSINVISYKGDRDVRGLIRNLEFYGEGGSVMFEVLLSHPDVVMEDSGLLQSINWEAVIVDEGQDVEILNSLEHLKNFTSDFRLLLLAFHPEDNLSKYERLLSFVDSGRKNSASMDSSDSTGTLTYIREKFSRYVAYQRKSNFSKFTEYWVPANLSDVQLELYCSTLLAYSSILQSVRNVDHVASIRGILIRLRKICVHPYLVDQSLRHSLVKDCPMTESLNVGVHACGKLLTLDKMLQEMRKRGLRSVIIYQSVAGTGRNPTGDILEDYLQKMFGSETYERVESGLVKSKKLHAVAMFNDKSKGRFAFLIEQSACLPSVRFSGVDAVIIYDSNWNLLGDIQALKRMEINSQADQINVFRLYSCCTVEEGILFAAKQNNVLDRNLKSISSSICHSLLRWGATCLFGKLEKIQEGSSIGDFECCKIIMEDIVKEMLAKLCIQDEAGSAKSVAAITKVQLSGESYSRMLTLACEREGIFLLDDNQESFWRTLLNKICPKWRFISEESQRSCREIEKHGKVLESTIEGDNEVQRKKWKVDCHKDFDVQDCLANKTNSHYDGSSDIPSDNLPFKSGDLKIGKSKGGLHRQLEPELVKLSEILELPESVKQMTMKCLEYMVIHHNVCQETKAILQAFYVALCWQASSILKHKLDHRNSVAIATKQLNYECDEELVATIYNRLKFLQKKFSRQAQESSDGNLPCSPTSEQSVSEGKTIDEDTNCATSRQDLFKAEHALKSRSLEPTLGSITFHQLDSGLEDKIYGEAEMAKLKAISNEQGRNCGSDLGGTTARIMDLDDNSNDLSIAFQEHMRGHNKKLEELQSAVRAKEHNMNNDWIEKAKLGNLDKSFKDLEAIPLPESAFVAEEFRLSCKEVNLSAKLPLSSSKDESSLGEAAIPVSTEGPPKDISDSFLVAGNALTSSGMQGAVVSTVVAVSDNAGIEENVAQKPICFEEAGTLWSTQKEKSASCAVSVTLEEPVVCEKENSGLSVPHGVSPTIGSGSPDCGKDTEHNQEPIFSEQIPGEHCTEETRLEDQSIRMVAGPVQNGVASMPEPAPEHVESMEPNEHSACSLAEIQPFQVSLRHEERPVLRGDDVPTTLMTPTNADALAPEIPDSQESAQVPSMDLSDVPLSGPMPVGLLDTMHAEHQGDGLSSQPGSSVPPSQSIPMLPLVFPPVHHPNPLKNELDRVKLQDEYITKRHEDKVLLLGRERELEYQNVRAKYEALYNEEKSSFVQQKMILKEMNDRILLNQILAEEFRATFIDTKRSSSKGNNQTPVAGTYHPQAASLPPSIPESSTGATLGSATRSPGSTALSRHGLPLSQQFGQSPSGPRVLTRNIISPIGISPTQRAPRLGYPVRGDGRSPAPHFQRLRPQVPPAGSGNVAQHASVPPAQQHLLPFLDSSGWPAQVLEGAMQPASQTNVSAYAGRAQVTPQARLNTVSDPQVPFQQTAAVGSGLSLLQPQIPSDPAVLPSVLASALGLRGDHSAMMIPGVHRSNDGGNVICLSDDEG